MVFIAIFCIVGLIASSQASVSEEALKGFLVYHDACVVETGVDVGETERARNGDVSDDPLLKQYFFCISRKAGFQDENGKYQIDVLRQKLSKEMDPEELEWLIKTCVIDHKDDPIEITYDGILCYKDNHQTGFHLEKAGA